MWSGLPAQSIWTVSPDLCVMHMVAFVTRAQQRHFSPNLVFIYMESRSKCEPWRYIFPQKRERNAFLRKFSVNLMKNRLRVGTRQSVFLMEKKLLNHLVGNIVAQRWLASLCRVHRRVCGTLSKSHVLLLVDYILHCTVLIWFDNQSFRHHPNDLVTLMSDKSLQINYRGWC